MVVVCDPFPAPSPTKIGGGASLSGDVDEIQQAARRGAAARWAETAEVETQVGGGAAEATAEGLAGGPAEAGGVEAVTVAVRGVKGAKDLAVPVDDGGHGGGSGGGESSGGSSEGGSSGGGGGGGTRGTRGRGRARGGGGGPLGPRDLVVGGTAWGLAHEAMAGAADWLVVDEAGQVPSPCPPLLLALLLRQ